MKDKNYEDDFLLRVNQNMGIVQQVCTIYFENPVDRQDVYQEILYQLWKSYARFKGNSKFSTWMYKVALNTSITYSKKSKRGIIYGNYFEKIKNIQDPVRDPENTEKLNLLDAKINTLNKIDKAIILLYLEDHNYEEIASITGLSLKNVSVRLVRIRRTLEKKIMEAATSFNNL